MCTEKHWKSCNTSAAYHTAVKFALELEEQAKLKGYKAKSIRVRTKEQIIKGGFGKSDAQVIWDEGPEGWTDNLVLVTSDDTDYVVEANTVSFYTR